MTSLFQYGLLLCLHSLGRFSIFTVNEYFQVSLNSKVISNMAKTPGLSSFNVIGLLITRHLWFCAGFPILPNQHCSCKASLYYLLLQGLCHLISICLMVYIFLPETFSLSFIGWVSNSFCKWELFTKWNVNSTQIPDLVKHDLYWRLSPSRVLIPISSDRSWVSIHPFQNNNFNFTCLKYRI